MDVRGIFKSIIKYHALVRQDPVLISRVYGRLLQLFWMVFIKPDITLFFVYQHAKHSAKPGKKTRSKLYDAAVPGI